MEGRGHAVGSSGAGQEVAGDLPHRELVERHVLVAGPDHPVAIAPDLPRTVIGIAGAVRVARQIEPLPRLMLTVAIVGQKPVDELLHSVG